MPEAIALPALLFVREEIRVIELSHICKDFGDGEGQVHAVRDVSLNIRESDIFGVIGFSGAGKSTLVRCINLLERPTSGSVIVDGLEMTALSKAELRAARKKIGMIFQHFNMAQITGMIMCHSPARMIFCVDIRAPFPQQIKVFPGG